MSLTIDEIPTPALVLDAPTLDRNLERMAARCTKLGVALRPHIKTHKCLEVARRQRALGARGITVSTLHEAKVFADHGFEDILWAFPIIPSRLDEVCDLSERVDLGIVVDTEAATEWVIGTGRPLRVWLKIDCGYHRAGVDPASPLVEAIAARLSAAPTIRFEGVLSHSGHAYDAPSVAARAEIAEHERAIMHGVAERLRDAGHEVRHVSVGSTPSMTAADDLTGVTEARPGNYALFDYTQVTLGTCAVTDCAATVLTTVISSQPGAGHAVVDAGALALSKDVGPHGGAPSMGRILDDDGNLDETLRLVSLSQEHGKLDRAVAPGMRLRVLPNHSCLTVAQFDEFYVVQGREVVDQWKVWRGRD